MTLFRFTGPLVVLGLLLGLSPRASATVGGPETLEVLGLAEQTAKLFLLRHDHSEAGLAPRALYFRVDLPPERRAPDAPYAIDSWYAGPRADEAEALAARKIAYLRRHLTPLEPVPLDGVELSLRHGDLTPCPRQQEKPDDTAIADGLGQARVNRRAGMVDAGGVVVSVCRRVTVTVRWEGREAQTTLLTWGGVELLDAWSVPGSKRRLVFLRHVGVTTETGYTRDVALLLP